MQPLFRVTSMLVTDVGDQMCWWQVWDVGDKLRQLPTSHSCVLWCHSTSYYDVTNMQKNITNLLFSSPISQNGHHHYVTILTMSPTSLAPYLVEIARFRGVFENCTNVPHLKLWKPVDTDFKTLKHCTPIWITFAAMLKMLSAQTDHICLDDSCLELIILKKCSVWSQKCAIKSMFILYLLFIGCVLTFYRRIR